jgi:O-antigen/teichoic acid export membrane protein
MHILLIIGGVLVFAMFSSTPEGRRQARERMRKYNLPLAIFVVIAWAIVITSLWWPKT